MKIANIATTKNTLSQLIEEVKAGESILIVDRKKPVARLEAFVARNEQEWGIELEDLERRGVVTLAKETFDIKRFLKMERPKLAAGYSLQDDLLAERSSGL